MGKTTLAQALARSFHCSFQRIQFTSDMLPSDVIGISVFNPRAQEFEFKPGPIFANIVLADEINRTTPKTQSALLEAMNEAQVTVDNHTHPLPQPFLVLATQNPIEHHGTYPLPESQLDRFLMRIRMGYPSRDERKGDHAQQLPAHAPLEQIAPVMEAADVVAMQETVAQVRVDDSLLDYALEIVERTRQTEQLSLGVSPRGAVMLHRAAQARAFLEGRDYCLPDDFKRLIVPGLRAPRGGQLALRLHAEEIRAGRSHSPRNSRNHPRSAVIHDRPIRSFSACGARAIAPGWRNFGVAMLVLSAALLLALFSAAVAQHGRILLAADHRGHRAGLAAWVAITIVPRWRGAPACAGWPIRSTTASRAKASFTSASFSILILAAVNTGNNLLFMILACLLAGILISGVLSRVVLTGIELKLTCPSTFSPSSRCSPNSNCATKSKLAVVFPARGRRKQSKARAQILTRPVFFPYIPRQTRRRAQKVELTFRIAAFTARMPSAFAPVSLSASSKKRARWIRSSKSSSIRASSPPSSSTKCCRC